MTPARDILSTAGITAGYALVLGDADASLLAALAIRSKLVIYHPQPGGDVAGARAKLAASGLYGTRVVLHDIALARLPYAEYFANLVLVRCGDSVAAPAVEAAEVYRVLRPCGGVAVVSFADALWPRIQEWLAAGPIPAAECKRVAGGLRIIRVRPSRRRFVDPSIRRSWQVLRFG